MKIYSPLRYPGGKNCIFNFLSKLFYENNLIGIEYAEPYAGGAGLALHLLMEGYVSKIYLNDLDEWVYSFWYTILNDADEFCAWVRKVKVNVANWNYYKAFLQRTGDISCFERAQAFFFLNRTNMSGVIKGGPIGGLAQQGKYKIDVRFNREDLADRILNVYKLRSKIEVSQLDGIEFLGRMNRKRRDIFIYIDPPYVIKGANLYANFYTQSDHENLSGMVRKLRKKWLISYDKCDLIPRLYTDYSLISYRLSQCTSNRIGEELLVFPDNILYEEAISELNMPIKL